MLPIAHPTGRPDDRFKVNLIRSLSSNADLRVPTSLLAEIQAVLDGADLDELVALRKRLDG